MASSKRINREKTTVEAMISLHCRARHQAAEGGLCEACRQLRSYAFERLDRCPFGAAKPTCARCTVHCFRPSMAEEIRAVMSWAGPRMLFHHPLLALAHLWDGVRTRLMGRGKRS